MRKNKRFACTRKRLYVQLKGENGMKKTIMTLSMAASISLGTIFAAMPEDKASAESIEELKDKSQEIQNKSSVIESEINKTTDQIADSSGRPR